MATMVLLTQNPPVNAAKDVMRKGLPFQMALNVWVCDRVFCRTKNGYMGMAPSGSADGDIVCAFMGARTPFVNRHQTDGFFQLIGACYIHGYRRREI
jgi:hypothetical protein